MSFNELTVYEDNVVLRKQISKLQETLMRLRVGGKPEIEKEIAKCFDLVVTGNKRIAELEKTVTLPEHIKVLRNTFQRDWKKNFEKIESDNVTLKKEIEKLQKEKYEQQFKG